MVSTTGAVVALVALAAMMSSSAVAAPAARVEARQSMREGAAVRAAVAAVAAAARHLVAGDRLVHALPAQWSAALAAPVVPSILCSVEASAMPPIAALPERLLDLPPPVV